MATNRDQEKKQLQKTKGGTENEKKGEEKRQEGRRREGKKRRKKHAEKGSNLSGKTPTWACWSAWMRGLLAGAVFFERA